MPKLLRNALLIFGFSFVSLILSSCANVPQYPPHRDAYVMGCCGESFFRFGSAYQPGSQEVHGDTDRADRGAADFDRNGGGRDGDGDHDGGGHGGGDGDGPGR